MYNIYSTKMYFLWKCIMHWCGYLHIPKSKYYSKESAIRLYCLLLKGLVPTIK